MSIESTSGPTSKTPLEPNWQGYPTTSSEFITVVAHYYRGEIARMISWRDRIDRTSNWAITVVGAMLSLSLATPAGHHGVILFAMVLVLFLLVINHAVTGSLTSTAPVCAASNETIMGGFSRPQLRWKATGCAY